MKVGEASYCLVNVRWIRAVRVLHVQFRKASNVFYNVGLLYVKG